MVEKSNQCLRMALNRHGKQIMPKGYAVDLRSHVVWLYLANKSLVIKIFVPLATLCILFDAILSFDHTGDVEPIS